MNKQSISHRSSTQPQRPHWWRQLLRFFIVMGPGFIVMQADTEAGSITTAAVAGAQYSYQLVGLLIFLALPLYVVQEMTARLGSVTGKGHAYLIRQKYGLQWAWVSLGILFVCNVAALVTEFAGIMSAGRIAHIPPVLSVAVSALLLLAVVMTGTYRTAEYIALAFCVADLLFIPAAFLAHPDWGRMFHESFSFSPQAFSRDYLLIVIGLIGAVIMPWMIYYQQSAVVDKKLNRGDLSFERLETGIGAVVTELIMAFIVVSTAATLCVNHVSVDDAAQAAQALIPLAGRYAGALFAIGLVSASFLGAFVVALSTAWAFGETFGWSHSLNLRPQQAKRFYSFYAAGVLIAAVIVLVPHIPLVAITVMVEVGNALLLPIVLTFLLLLTNDRKLLGDHVNGWFGNLLTITTGVVIILLGLLSGVMTLFPNWTPWK
jgi:NRAMP (natural resistance-associated macrophage protein)-like metal ion transporter